VTWNFDFLQQLDERRLSNGRVFMSERGTGPALLFVHGGFHGAWCWAEFLRFFKSQNIPVAAVDLRGHGGLPQTDAFLKTGVREMAADVTEAAATLGGPIVLVGHSLGALVAMAAAETIRPVGLILLAPSPPNNVPDIKRLPPFPEGQLIAPPPAERTRKWFLSGYSGSDIQPYLDRMTPESPAFLNDRYMARISADPLWVQGPTLVVSAGKDDTLLHPAGQDEAIAAYYGAEFQMIPEAGHCFMADDSAEASAHLLLDWLKRKNLMGKL
jgi:pimeloyl-ACP methyl ester carboxylesterase